MTSTLLCRQHKRAKICLKSSQKKSPFVKRLYQEGQRLVKEKGQKAALEILANAIGDYISKLAKEVE
ncbi:MAG: hypothetical protein RR614_03215 [Eubacterium sp.]